MSAKAAEDIPCRFHARQNSYLPVKMQPSISVIENKTRQTKRRGNNTLQLSTPFCCISRQAKGYFAKKIKQCEIKIYPLDKRTIILYTQFCQLNKIFRAGCKSLPAVQPASRKA